MQDYKLIVRALTGGATKLSQTGVIEVQNFSEFLSYINDQYLGQGYKIVSAENVRTIPPDPNVPNSTVVYEFAYHLVKELDNKGK